MCKGKLPCGSRGEEPEHAPRKGNPGRFANCKGNNTGSGKTGQLIPGIVGGVRGTGSNETTLYHEDFERRVNPNDIISRRPVSRKCRRKVNYEHSATFSRVLERYIEEKKVRERA